VVHVEEERDVAGSHPGPESRLDVDLYNDREVPSVVFE
jgi:hypothetical protein